MLEDVVFPVVDQASQMLTTRELSDVATAAAVEAAEDPTSANQRAAQRYFENLNFEKNAIRRLQEAADQLGDLVEIGAPPRQPDHMRVDAMLRLHDGRSVIVDSRLKFDARAIRRLIVDTAQTGESLLVITSRLTDEEADRLPLIGGDELAGRHVAFCVNETESITDGIRALLGRTVEDTKGIMLMSKNLISWSRRDGQFGVTVGGD